jgi:hypothetical protein
MNNFEVIIFLKVQISQTGPMETATYWDQESSPLVETPATKKVPPGAHFTGSHRPRGLWLLHLTILSRSYPGNPTFWFQILLQPHPPHPSKTIQSNQLRG